MSGFAAEWLNLLIRWGHIAVGIAWIGASFYFIALDLGLRKRAGMRDGVAGTAWQVHGGGFYHVEKYLVAPTDLPGELVWFRWEAYLTWITGFALLAIQYYFNADLYLIDRAVLDVPPFVAVLISVVTLAAGWFAYDFLCRSPAGRNPLLLGAGVFVLIVVATVLFQNVFSGRGALIHVGALVGTIMAANVFAVIIPNQRRITASLLAHEPPDPALGKVSKQRSVHNNYLTLPVLVLMVSNHYPLLTGHHQLWLIVALLLVLGASIRHLINRHDAGDPLRRFVWALPVALIALAAAVIATAPAPATLPADLVVTDSEALAVVSERCAGCHSATPTIAGFPTAPRGITLDTVEDLRREARAIQRQAIGSRAMPPGNITDMTDEERTMLAVWIAAQ